MLPIVTTTQLLTQQHKTKKQLLKKFYNTPVANQSCNYANTTNTIVKNYVSSQIKSLFFFFKKKKKKIFKIGNLKNPKILKKKMFNLLCALNYSKTSLYTYSFLFWTFYYNATNSKFIKKKNNINNNTSTLSKFSRKLPRTLSSVFLKQNGTIKRLNKALFALPTLTALNYNKKKTSSLSPIFFSSKQLNILLAFSLASQLNNKKYYVSQTSVNKQKRHALLTGASKTIFALNQYITNLIVTR